MDKLDQWMSRTVGTKKSEKSKTENKNSNKKNDQKSKKGFLSKVKDSFNKKGNSSKSSHPNSKKKHTSKNANSSQNSNNSHRSSHSKSNSNKSNNQKNYKSKSRNNRQNSNHTRKSKPTPILKGKVKIIPLGGLNEVGKNMMAVEYEDDIVIIDMGFEFPSEDMLGIDYVIPDVTYLEDNKDRIRGVLITHGHLDHIGGVPYILPKLGYPPVFSGRLTLGLIEQKIKEFKLEKYTKLRAVHPKEAIKLGKMTGTFFRVSHSIPDAFGIILDTPEGKLVHTGDFKFDPTPPRNIEVADVNTIEALGQQNVLALFCESTNSMKPGHTMSEKEVGEELEQLIRNTSGRVIIASFSSQIGRLQQILDAAVNNNRKVFVSGRSMTNNIETSFKLGYLKFPKNYVQDIRKYKSQSKNLKDEDTLILTTGSQGEAVSALSRMARNEHAHIKVKKRDTIILSSSPIVGNEKAINTVINNLCILGADVIHNQMADIHTSGHAKQEELIRMITSIKPKYLIPVHGEYYMRQSLVKLAREQCGIPEDNIIMLQNGDVLLAEKGKVEKSPEKIETKYILIDGSGEGHIGSQVQYDREILSQNGALIVMLYISRKTRKIKRRPDVISRGFIYMHESNQIMKEIGIEAEKAYKKLIDKNPKAERRDVKKYVQQALDKHTHKTLERRPLIIPILVEM